MEFIMRLHVCLIRRTSFDFKEKGGKKLFLPNQSINPNKEYMFIMPNHEKNKDYHENPSLPHLRMTLILRKTVERKTLYAKPKHQYHVS